jgi:apolipoprotein N-acyltransferase
VKPRVFAPAIASGVLLWLAFFPADLGPLGFVALAPWLTLFARPVSRGGGTSRRTWAGSPFFALATNWVRVAHPMMYLSWLGLASSCRCSGWPRSASIRRLDRRRVPLAVSAPVAWVALEYARMHFPTGFTFMRHVGAYQMIGFGWYFLGYTQHAFTPLIQIADLGGVYAVSFVVAAVNGALAGLMTRRPTPLPEGKGESDTASAPTSAAREGSFSPFPSGRGAGGVGFALALLGAGVGYGYWRLDHPPFADGPVVAAVQGNLSQGDKMGDPKGLLASYTDLHFRAVQYDRTAKKFFGPSPDLVVWPETCCPMDWCAVAPGARLDAAPGRVPAAPPRVAGLLPRARVGGPGAVRADRAGVGRLPGVEVQLGGVW